MDITRAITIAEDMLKDHGLYDWHIQKRNYKATGAVTYYGMKQIGISPKLVELWDETDFRQIILHEIAHVLVGPGHGHDRVWLRTARSIGYTGNRAHDLATVEARWAVVCENCGELGRRHRRSRKKVVCIACRGNVEFRDMKSTSV